MKSRHKILFIIMAFIFTVSSAQAVTGDLNLWILNNTNKLIRPATGVSQVLIGATATTSGSNLEVHGGITSDNATTTNQEISGTLNNSVLGDLFYGGNSGAVSRLPIGTANQVLHGGATIPQYGYVTEDDISLSNVTTNNVNTSRHGFAPTLSNVSTQFLNGQGNWVTPSGIANAYISQSFTNTSTVTVIHNFGTNPVVTVLAGGQMIIPKDVIFTNINQFTVDFSFATSGTIMASVGSPQLNTYVTVNGNYTATTNDYIIKETAASSIVTLPTAVGNSSKTYVIKNSSAGSIDIVGTGGQTIDGNADVTLSTLDSISVLSDGSNWLIY